MSLARRAVLVLILAPLIPAALPAQAQGTRPGDVPFAADALSAALSGRVLEFHDDSRARYGADGAYTYRYRPGDPPFRGTWETTEDSAVCVTFDNGFSRCDVIVRAAGRLVLITEEGLRFPVREVRPAS
jgi:hypothetical protein